MSTLSSESASESSLTAAVTARQTLTTPFIPPQSCANQFITTSYTEYYGKTSTLTILASGPADPQFASCQPLEWNAGTSALEFSPAVCPSGWTGYSLDGYTTKLVVSPTNLNSSSPFTTWKNVTTAYCCSSGFSLSSFFHIPTALDIPDTACFQAPTGEVINTAAPVSTLRIHHAWCISWEASDTPFLSPTAPLRGCTTTWIDSWVPGATVYSGPVGPTCDPNHLDHLNIDGIIITIVTMPVVFLIIIIGTSVCICRERAKKKKRAERLGISLESRTGNTGRQADGNGGRRRRSSSSTILVN